MSTSINVINYLWEHGIYNLEDMKRLVILKEITEEEFFQITRKKYAGVSSKIF